MSSIVSSMRLAGVELVTSQRGIRGIDNLLGGSSRGDYVPLQADGGRELVHRLDARTLTIDALITGMTTAEKWASWHEVSRAADAANRGPVTLEWTPNIPGMPTLQTTVRLAGSLNAPIETGAGALAYTLTLRSESPIWESTELQTITAADNATFQVINDGGASAWPVFTIHGGAGGSATIRNNDTGGTIVVSQAGGVPAGTDLKLISAPWNRRVKIGSTNTPSLLDWASSTWIRAIPGSNQFHFNGPANSSLTVEWRDSWM